MALALTIFPKNEAISGRAAERELSLELFVPVPIKKDFLLLVAESLTPVNNLLSELKFFCLCLLCPGIAVTTIGLFVKDYI